MHLLPGRVLLLLVITLIGCAPTTSPTLPPATQPAITSEGPSLTLGNWHDMFYHEQTAQVVLVNGGPETGKSPSEPIELWSWNGEHWSLLSADPLGPRWRNFASIAYNSKRKVLVLYGGLTAEKNFKDTWEWDGKIWTHFTVEGPGLREAAGMAYDSERDRIILFGGAQLGKMMNDTWEWDGVQWTNISSDGPTARFPAGFAYDITKKYVLLFGGHAFGVQGYTTYGDTWKWDGAAWEQISSAGPSARDGARMIFDPSSGQILLFGGAKVDSTVTNLNDTWLWDGARWEQTDVEGPPARVHPAIAFDESRGVVVMTGGSNGPGAILTDTWEWDGQAWACMDGCK